MSNTTVQCLSPGDNFEITSLKDSMRNLQVVSNGSGGTIVKGEKRDGIDDNEFSWHPFQYAIANSCPVVFLSKGEVSDKKAEIKNKGKVTPVAEKPAESAPKPKKVASKADKAPMSRGRPSKNIQIAFPSGEFTLADVAEANKVEKYDVSNFILKSKNAGNPILLQEIGTRKNPGRGKPAKVFRLM